MDYLGWKAELSSFSFYRRSYYRVVMDEVVLLYITKNVSKTVSWK